MEFVRKLFLWALGNDELELGALIHCGDYWQQLLLQTLRAVDGELGSHCPARSLSSLRTGLPVDQCHLLGLIQRRVCKRSCCQYTALCSHPQWGSMLPVQVHHCQVLTERASVQIPWTRGIIQLTHSIWSHQAEAVLVTGRNSTRGYRHTLYSLHVLQATTSQSTDCWFPLCGCEGPWAQSTGLWHPLSYRDGTDSF